MNDVVVMIENQWSMILRNWPRWLIMVKLGWGKLGSTFTTVRNMNRRGANLLGQPPHTDTKRGQEDNQLPDSDFRDIQNQNFSQGHLGSIARQGWT